jgi:predicted nucleic acid-binding protein
MIVCIDTNVLIQARAKTHPFHCILRACALGAMSWAVSNRILTEYREVIMTLNDVSAWGRVTQLLDLIHRTGTLIMVSPHYQFRVISTIPTTTPSPTAPSPRTQTLSSPKTGTTFL